MSLDDFLTPSFFISVAGVTLGFANFLYTKRKTQFEAQRQQLLLTLDRVIDATREASEETVRHLSFQKGRKVAFDIYRLVKKCSLAVESLAVLLPSRRSALEADFAKWVNAMTGEGFPVSKKAASFAATSDRCQQVETAQKQIETWLNRLRKECCDSGAKIV